MAHQRLQLDYPGRQSTNCSRLPYSSSRPLLGFFDPSTEEASEEYPRLNQERRRNRRIRIPIDSTMRQPSLVNAELQDTRLNATPRTDAVAEYLLRLSDMNGGEIRCGVQWTNTAPSQQAVLTMTD
jgi:hypothetical protein